MQNDVDYVDSTYESIKFEKPNPTPQWMEGKTWYWQGKLKGSGQMQQGAGVTMKECVDEARQKAELWPPKT